MFTFYNGTLFSSDSTIIADNHQCNIFLNFHTSLTWCMRLEKNECISIDNFIYVIKIRTKSRFNFHFIYFYVQVILISHYLGTALGIMISICACFNRTFYYNNLN